MKYDGINEGLESIECNDEGSFYRLAVAAEK